MNVLLYVMAMLMLLSLISYARIESYRSSQIFQTLFSYYMESDERGPVNLAYKKQYDDVTGSSRKLKENPNPKIQASSRISLSLFVDTKKREANASEFQQSKVLLKNLIDELYKNHQFYDKMLQERPHFVDELISSIINTIDSLPAKNRLKKAADLSNLILPDPQLNETLYKMLHGAPYKYDLSDREAREAKKDIINSLEDTTQDTEQIHVEISEHSSPQGYYSLSDFITFAPSKQIRVYLASRDVLQAIFHDPNIVQEILDQRKELHREVLNKADPKDLEPIFRGKFEQSRDPAIESSFLNFQVSGTDPERYE